MQTVILLHYSNSSGGSNHNWVGKLASEGARYLLEEGGGVHIIEITAFVKITSNK